MNRTIVSVIALLLVPTAALGQVSGSSPPSSPAATPQPPAPKAPGAGQSLADSLQGAAKADYEAAKLLYRDGDFRGALVKFQAAFASSKDPRLLWNMAVCQKELRHYAKAVADINRYIVEGGAVLTEQDRAEAISKRDTLQTFVSPVTVRVNEPEADILLDDEVVGRSPMATPVVTDIGEHHFSIRKAGFRTFVQTLQVSGPVSLDVQLLAEMHRGQLEVRAPEGASISVDGQPRGLGIWTGVLASGTHTVRVIAPKMRAYQSEIAIRDDDTRTLSLTLEPDDKGGGGAPAWLWLTGGAVVVAGAAVGGYFLLHKEPAASQPEVGTLPPGTVQLQVFR
jgi:PEGA domain